MPGIAEMQENLRRVLKEIDTAKGKKETARREASELEEALPGMRRFIEAENDRISRIFRIMEEDLARVATMERFRRRFEEDVRSILQGNRVKSALSAMESAVNAIQTDKGSKDKAADGAENEIRTLQARAEDIKRRIREQEQTGVQE